MPRVDESSVASSISAKRCLFSEASRDHGGAEWPTSKAAPERNADSCQPTLPRPVLTPLTPPPPPAWRKGRGRGIERGSWFGIEVGGRGRGRSAGKGPQPRRRRSGQCGDGAVQDAARSCGIATGSRAAICAAAPGYCVPPSTRKLLGATRTTSCASRRVDFPATRAAASGNMPRLRPPGCLAPPASRQRTSPADTVIVSSGRRVELACDADEAPTWDSSIAAEGVVETRRRRLSHLCL